MTQLYPRTAAALVTGLAPPGTRTSLDALFALDARLGQIVASTSEPLLGQMRLAWWGDALLKLDSNPAPAEPILRAIAAQLLPMGVSSADLAEMCQGWEALLIAGQVDQAALLVYAEQRGAQLFSIGARLLGGSPGEALRSAGRAWALADLALRTSKPAFREMAAQEAMVALDHSFSGRWNTSIRPFGILTLLTANDLDHARGVTRSWRSAAALLRFRIVGKR
jgi:phytoene synthase